MGLSFESCGQKLNSLGNFLSKLPNTTFHQIPSSSFGDAIYE